MNTNQPSLESNEPAYWDNRYLDNDTGWDMNQPSPPLQFYIDSLQDSEINILVPGCGNAHEANYLLQKGFNNVTLIDFSKVVTDRLKENYKGKPIKIINENFFEHSGNYDLILEQTFLCALNRSLQKQYPEKCYHLLNPGGKIAGVLFNKKFTDTEPPYILEDAEYKELFKPLFILNRYEECKNSIGPRLGTEVFFEFERKEGLV